MKLILIVVPVAVLAVGGAASTLVRVRSGLAAERAAIGASWAGVDEALRERATLIRDLAGLMQAAGLPVEPIAREIADAQAELQRATTPQPRIRAHERLSRDLGRLLEAEDAHGPKKTGAAGSRLQDQIRDAEEKIAVARRRYNETLEHYNTRIQTFPNNLVAKIAGFTRDDAYFRTDPF